jgi:hypothetical protein
VLLMEASRESEIRQLDVTVLVDEDVVGLDVAGGAERRGERSASILMESGLREAIMNSPMNEAQLVDCLDSQHTLGHVEPRHVLREGVVLDEHGHEISSR